MKLFRYIHIGLFFCLIGTSAYGQVDSTAVDSTRQDTTLQRIAPESVALRDSADADTLMKPAFKVFPWKYNTSLVAQPVSSDSTLRWQVWPNWVYKKNRDPGVITYRLGTIGRTNAFMIHSDGPRYQQLLWEDVNMNDPVSGTVNWDVIPLQKLRQFYESDDGINHTSGYYLKQYYLTKPLSQLVYKESKFDTRSLEFIVSRNFGPKTNAEVSYWDRRDGDEYPNSSVGGRQIFVRVFHQLDHQQAIKIHYLNNNYTIGEPFGYNIVDLSRFAFDRFQTNPEQGSAKSELTASNLAVNYYRRSSDTTDVSASHFRAGLFFNSRERELTYSRDSTYYKVQSVGVNAHKWFRFGPVELEAKISDEWFMNRDRDRSDLNIDNWNLLTGNMSALIRPVFFWEISGGLEGRNRSDGYSAYKVNVGTAIDAGRLIRVSGGLASGTVMPTPQQLYWSSGEYRGNPDLLNETVTSFYGEASFRVSRSLNIGFRGQLKDIENGIMVEQDSLFTNFNPYNSLSASTYFDFDNERFELRGSATYHRYDQLLRPVEEPLPMDGSERVWLKGGAYVKGYLFNRAAYVKAGLSGMISPFRYQAEHYNPVLDFWQPVSDDQFLPSFDRLDVDISARVRTLMITLRWENVLDDVSQLGYFETAQYPMGQRRFIFGIRALFRD